MFRREVSAVVRRCFTDSGAEQVFDAKMGAPRYLKEPKWSQKVNQNEPRNLQRHDFRTEPDKYRKRMPKGANPGTHGTKIVDTSKNTIPKNHPNISHRITLTFMSTRCQREPEIIGFSISLRKGDFR